jgi:hypothetical protein
MRVALGLLGALFSSTCLAATLPILGDYGGPAACAVQPPFSGDTGDLWLLVTRTAVEGLEWGCSFDSVRTKGKTYSVSASCAVEGVTSHETLTFSENSARGTLSFVGMGLRVTLNRCP